MKAAAGGPAQPETLLSCLADLFEQISSQKKRTGVIAPRKFVQRLRQENEIFSSYMHQDAHEFLNYLLNECCEILEKEEKARREAEAEAGGGGGGGGGARAEERGSSGAGPAPGREPVRTFIHEMFQGKLVNETRCLCCENVTSRDETFLDLSVDVEANSSVSSCLQQFSSTETMQGDEKFHCDNCCSLQEAQRRMKVKQLPLVFAIHLKRFKYIEELGRYKKLADRVLFPLELKLRHTADGAEGADLAYRLFAVVVHVGSGPNHGHYVSAVKAVDRWLFVDDDSVDSIDESTLYNFFGHSSGDHGANTEHGYILMYSQIPREEAPGVGEGRGAGEGDRGGGGGAEGRADAVR